MQTRDSNKGQQFSAMLTWNIILLGNVSCNKRYTKRKSYIREIMDVAVTSHVQSRIHPLFLSIESSDILYQYIESWYKALKLIFISFGVENDIYLYC